MSTSTNYSSSSKPILVPKGCDIFARQSLFNVLHCLSALKFDVSGCVPLKDVKDAISFVMSLYPAERTDIELEQVNIFSYHDDEEDSPF